MNSKTQTINYTSYNLADIIKWEEEIRVYNEEHEDNDVLVIPNVFLKYQITDASNYILTKAYNLEKEITYDLFECLNNGYFVNLEKRIKGRNRIETKIYNRFIKYKRDIFLIANEIDDILRYTIIYDYETYTSNVNEYLIRLEELGYQIFRLKNRWNEAFYKGINVKIKSPNGFIFEIQFHTEDNLKIIEHQTREPYKIVRSNNVPLHLKVKAYLVRSFYQQEVRIPEGAIDYNYQSHINKLLVKE